MNQKIGKVLGCAISLTTMTTALAALSLPAFADLQGFNADPSVEIGGGVLLSADAKTPDSGVDALLRVRYKSGSLEGPAQFVWVKLRGDVAGGTSGVGYVDVQLDVANIRSGDEAAHLDLSAVDFSIQRDLKIDEGLTARVNFLGIRGGAKGEISDRVKAFINGSIDLLGISISQRQSDGTSITGYGMGGSISAGLEISSRYRITLGERFDATLAGPEAVPNGGQSCVSYTDSYGFTTMDCQQTTTTIFHQRLVSSKTYLSFTAALADHLSAFAQTNLNVYSVSDDYGSVPNSSNTALEFLFGLSGKF